MFFAAATGARPVDQVDTLPCDFREGLGPGMLPTPEEAQSGSAWPAKGAAIQPGSALTRRARKPGRACRSAAGLEASL